eukprot:gene14158-16743_t
MAARSLWPEGAEELRAMAARSLWPEGAEGVRAMAARSLWAEGAEGLWAMAARSLWPEGAEGLRAMAARSLWAEGKAECTLGATGLYCCRVSNIFGEVETEPTDPPKIVALRPTSLKVVEGESFEVMVKVTGNPKPTYQWWKDGDLLPQYEEPVLAGYDGVCNLLERSAAVQHTGRYVCKASNAVEDVYSQEVIVKVFRSVELLRAEDFHTRALE